MTKERQSNRESKKKPAMTLKVEDLEALSHFYSSGT